MVLAVENLLKYGIPGLSVVLFAFCFFLLRRECAKVKPDVTALKTIRIFLYLVSLLIVIFLCFKLSNVLIQDKKEERSLEREKEKLAENKWTIKGKIELKDENNKTLDEITKDIDGELLSKPIAIGKFLEDNIIITTEQGGHKTIAFLFKSLKNFTTTISRPNMNIEPKPEITFSINGYRCIAGNNVMEINGFINENKEPMVFVKNEKDYNRTDFLSETK